MKRPPKRENPDRALRMISAELSPSFWDGLEAERQAAEASGKHIDPAFYRYDNDMLFQACSKFGARLLRRAANQLEERRQRGTALLYYRSLASIAHWRLTKGVYEFDPELNDALDQSDVGSLPLDAVRNLPEYAPYIVLDREYMGVHVYGAWVCRGDTGKGEDGVQVVAHGPNGWLHCIVLFMDTDIDATLSRAYQNLNADGLSSAVMLQEGKRLVTDVLKRALYLASTEPDLTGVVRKPQFFKRISHGASIITTDPPRAANVIGVGYRYGAAVRTWKQQERETREGGAPTGTTVAPHIRRAHYHLYWTGKGRKEPRVKWIAPVLVGAKDVEAIATTVRAVKPSPSKEEDKS